MAKKVKRVVSRVHDEVRERTPFTLGWPLFVGKDGAEHCKAYGTAPRHMRPVGKVWRPDTKSVREMELRRRGKVKGSPSDTTAKVYPTTTELARGVAAQDEN